VNEGARTRNFPQPSPIIAANSPPKNSFYSALESRHFREVEGTTHNQMSEMPNITRASTRNYYEPDELYRPQFQNSKYGSWFIFSETANTGFILQASLPWVNLQVGNHPAIQSHRTLKAQQNTNSMSLILNWGGVSWLQRWTSSRVFITTPKLPRESVMLFLMHPKKVSVFLIRA
jgi:hypothetical protein